MFFFLFFYLPLDTHFLFLSKRCPNPQFARDFLHLSFRVLPRKHGSGTLPVSGFFCYLILLCDLLKQAVLFSVKINKQREQMMSTLHLWDHGPCKIRPNVLIILHITFMYCVSPPHTRPSPNDKTLQKGCVRWALNNIYLGYCSF